MSKAKKRRTTYSTKNWKAYNSALKARGALTLWLDRDMQWLAASSGKRGRQQTFSDAAIQFCPSIKGLFRLALRQTLRLVESLLRLAGLDYSTVCRRQKTLQVHLGIDAQTLEIRAVEVTSNTIGDAPMLPELLAQIAPEEAIASVCADGAYDTRALPGRDRPARGAGGDSSAQERQPVAPAQSGRRVS